MRSLRFAVLASAALLLPGSLIAQTSVKLREAYVETPESGPSVVYLADSFRATPSDDILVITYDRATPMWHFNSPRDEVNAIDAYLRAHSSFGAPHMVAVVSEKPRIRVFIKPVADLELAAFSMPRTRIAKASFADTRLLKSIGTPHFARYLVEAVEERSRLVAQMFGNRAPGLPEVELVAVVSTADAAAAKNLVRAFKKNSPVPGFKTSFAGQDKAVTASAAIPFDKDRVQSFFKIVCDMAAQHQAACVDWRLKTASQKMQLSPP